MSLFSRFFGKLDDDDPPKAKTLIANANIEEPLGLQVLFAEKVSLYPKKLTAALEAYDRGIRKVKCEFDPTLGKQGNLLGMVGWDQHVIKLVGFDAPMPKEAVELCVAPAHYPTALKKKAHAHKAHVLLYYAGYEESPIEQYVALAATAGVLTEFGAIVVLNESAHTSFPAHALSEADSEEGMLELLRTLPRPILYCGFVKHEVEDIPGVWMRTYGAPLLGFPDLAVHAAGHDEGERYFGIFNNVFCYLEDSGARLAPGNTMQIETEEYLKFRSPLKEEEFLESDGALLVIEIIKPDEINRKGNRK